MHHDYHGIFPCFRPKAKCLIQNDVCWPIARAGVNGGELGVCADHVQIGNLGLGPGTWTVPTTPLRYIADK